MQFEDGSSENSLDNNFESNCYNALSKSAFALMKKEMANELKSICIAKICFGMARLPQI